VLCIGVLLKKQIITHKHSLINISAAQVGDDVVMRDKG
jgi:hypothetical protein